jgi:D-alanine-D-alanine ligase-like ATP-grasp enzyme
LLRQSEARRYSRALTYMLNYMTEDGLRDFVLQREDEGVGIKSAMIEWAALEREMKVTRYTPQVIVAKNASTQLSFRDMNGPSSGPGGKYICDAKEHSREFLSDAGLSVTPSRAFHKSERDSAWDYAKCIDGPVVVKPTGLSRGRGITLNITTEEHFISAWRTAVSAYAGTQRAHNLLVEKQATGDDYRLFVTTGPKPVVLATLKRRARVVGDGERSVRRLIRRKNRWRSRNPYLANFPIPEDLASLDRLQESGHDLDYVPADKERVTLRSVSNLNAGGDSVDYTHKIHPEYRDLAIRAVRAIPGIDYAGVDVITRDITEKPTPNNHVISEVEYSPAPLTHFPISGGVRDMAGVILDHYLDEDKPSILGRMTKALRR